MLFGGRNASVDRLYLFSYFAEIADELVQENQPNPALFRLLLASVEAGERNPVMHPLVRYYRNLEPEIKRLASQLCLLLELR